MIPEYFDHNKRLRFVLRIIKFSNDIDEIEELL